jgi:hypothetical protein
MSANSGDIVEAGRRWPRRRIVGPVAVVAVLAALLVSGCTRRSDERLKSSAAAPLIVCGTPLETTAGGAVLSDASMSSFTTTIRGQSANGIFLETAKGCTAGASITVVPATAAKQAKVAHTSDGRLAAVVLTRFAARRVTECCEHRRRSPVDHMSMASRTVTMSPTVSRSALRTDVFTGTT